MMERNQKEKRLFSCVSGTTSKEFSMKKAYKLIWIIALIAIVGFSLAACDNGNGGSGGDGNGGNSGGNSIIGKWYTNISSTIPVYEFTSDGRFLVVGVNRGHTYSASGGKLTLYRTDIITGQISTMGTADYTISGNSLTIFNSSANSGIVEGTYYKK